MSQHYKFEVHIKTPGEEDREEQLVEFLKRTVGIIAEQRLFADLEVTVWDVERT